jgi:hypothetical protein
MSRHSRRSLDVGSDGKASVLLLTDPIPRHLSIVSWGANDTPAASWKSAETDNMIAAHTLRSPPGSEVTDPETVSTQALMSFLNDTMAAWVAVMNATLATPLESADRAAQMRALTVQAGARVAAVATALGAAAATAVASEKAAELSMPALPTAPTLDGEMRRHQMSTAIDEVAQALTSATVKMIQKGGAVTENVLSTFSLVADQFSYWAAESPRGVVGVANKSVDSTELANVSSKMENVSGSMSVKFRIFIKSDGWTEWATVGNQPAKGIQAVLLEDGKELLRSSKYLWPEGHNPRAGKTPQNSDVEFSPSLMDQQREARTQANKWARDAVARRKARNSSRKSVDSTELANVTFRLDVIKDAGLISPMETREKTGVAETKTDPNSKWSGWFPSAAKASAFQAVLVEDGKEMLRSVQYKFAKKTPGYGDTFELRPSPDETESKARSEAAAWGKEAVRKRKAVNSRKSGVSPQSSTSSEIDMSLKFEDLESLAQEDPKRFLSTIKTAVANAKGADSTFKFMWGETGEDAFGADQIVNMLKQSGGAGIQSLIAGAVSGVKIDGAQTDNTQVASAMKSVMMDDLTSANGVLKNAIASALAPLIAESVVASVKATWDNGAGNPGGVGGDAFDFSVADDELDLTADLPGS